MVTGSNSTSLEVIKASAGSGKTYTLALRYIEQLLFKLDASGKFELRNRDDYHRHILAITFTNKATNEMKQRIVKQLHVLSIDPSLSDYYDEFKKNCTTQALAGLKDAAQKALSAILFDYSQFNVSTIDSFFQSIMRSFARELDRDYNFELQIDSDHAIMIAVHNFLLSLGKDVARTKGEMTPVEKWVKDFLRSQSAEGKSWGDLFKDYGGPLFGIARNITNEFFNDRMPALRDYLTDASGNSDLSRITEFKKTLEETAKKIIKTDWKSRLEEALSAERFTVDALKSNSALKNGLFNSPESAPTESFEKLLDGDISKQFYTKFNPTATVCETLKSLVKDKIKYHLIARMCEQIAKNLAMVGLLGEIDKNLEEYRRESNSVLIADTNELISRVIDNSHGAPFIYERTGTWINHFLLDEFQDTSGKQYHNFKPLLDESLSNNHFNLIIGDAKQAIYRFRNADPSLFRDQINKDFSGARDITLEHNWRSQKNIIEFNNRFFEKLLGHFTDKGTITRTFMPNGDEKDYKQLVPSKHETPAGMVRVIFNDNAMNELAKESQSTQMLPAYLLELHKRFEWKDINILVNKNHDGSVIVDAILEHNMRVREEGHACDEIPVVSGEMMALNKSVAVCRIVSLLRFIDLTNYIVNYADEDVHIREEAHKSLTKRRLSVQRQIAVLGKFIKALNNRKTAMTPTQVGDMLKQSFVEVDQTVGTDVDAQTRAYAEQLAKSLPDSRTQPMSLVNIVEHIIANNLNVSESAHETIFLHSFHNCIMDFAAKRNGGTVREFLSYWDQKSDKITVPATESTNAVNILTIHKAKGLEADCIVIPKASWEIEADAHYDTTYWIDGKTWIDEGMRDFLEKENLDKLDESIVAPILQVNKSILRNLASTGYYSQFTSSRDQDMYIDNINKTYVAFTRPCKELHIFAVKSIKRGCIYDKMASIIPAMVSDGYFRQLSIEEIPSVNPELPQPQDGTGWYQMGEPYVKPATVDSASVAERQYKEEAEKQFEVTWQPVPLPPYEVSRSVVKVSLPEDETSACSVGKRLHALMSRINYVSDCEQALNYCLRRGIITDVDTDEWNVNRLRQLCERLGTEAPYSEWFACDNEILNERSILVRATAPETNEEKLVVVRPDRIIRRPDGRVVVVDYKFGKNVEDKYVTQVSNYIKALLDAGESQVEGYLWYVELDEIKQVTL